MRRWWPYLLLTLLALPGLWPLAGAGLPRTNDALTHLYRAVELDALARAGVLFPRWAPDLVHGYGYPVFNFFPYLAHHLVVALHALGLNFLAAYNTACALALLASAWWAYRLARDHFGEAAGLVAGVAYLYSPYLLYDTYIRGSLPENLALALLPLALLGLRRAAAGQPRAGAWAALALAAALFSHHGVMLQAMPFVAAYGAVAVWTQRRGAWRAALPPYVLSFTLALLLTAFFWLPALLEAGYVQIERGTGNGGMNYADNFLSLGELLAWARLPADPALLNPPVVRPLPLPALVLAGLALVRGVVGRASLAASQTRWLVFFALAALTGTLLIHPLARPVWDTLPLLRLTLFPWRLLGPVSLVIALLAGAFFTALPRPAEQSGKLPAQVPSYAFIALFLVSLTGLIVPALPFAAPPRESAPAAPTLADVAAFEIPPTFIGTTTVGEYLPAWVRALPDTAPNRNQLLAGQPVQRHEAPGAEVAVLASRPAADTYRVTAPAGGVTFVYRAFYFPGWRATLNGAPVAITVTHPHGLISVVMPEGAHTLRLFFGTTAARVAGVVLSLLGVAGVAGWLMVARARPAQAVMALGALPPLLGQPAAAPRYLAEATLIVAIALIAFRLLFDAGRTPLLRSGPALAAPLHLDFATELTLLGAEAEAQAVTADETLRVNLYWQPNHPLGIPYGFDVRLVDEAGHTWSQPDVVRPRDWRFTPGTDFWPAGQYVLDPYLLQPIPGTPPGAYAVRVNVFAVPTLQSIGAQSVLPVTITAPSRARACPASAPAEAAWDGVALASAGFSAAAAGPGDDLVFSPCWHVRAAPGAHAPLAAELRLLSGDGGVVYTQPFTPGAPYPASRWQPGDALRNQVDVRLPAALDTGAYAWELAVNGAGPVPLGALAVTAPERAFTPLESGDLINGGLGPLTLHGVTVAREATPGADLPLALVWHAEALLPESYHVFVHLLAPDGSLAAQSDGVPAGWTRRTTGWLPGEYVTDGRVLFLRPDLAPGAYTLWAGVYLPATGQRLTTSAYPDGRVPLGSVLIE